MIDKTIHYEETPFGFDYGAAKITRQCYDDKRGWVTIQLDTPKHTLLIRVTKKGKVRIHDAHGEWVMKQEENI